MTDDSPKSELAELADDWREARDEERARWLNLKRAIAQAARNGVPEVQLVRETGVSRVTVRKAMGKDGGSAAVDGPELRQLKPAGERHRSDES